MRTPTAPALLLLALIPGCGGGGGGGDDGANGGAIPPAAATLESQIKTGMAGFAPLVSNVETSLVLILTAGTPLTPRVVVQPDPSPTAAPYSVVFSGPFDGNGDGVDETTLSGRATFRSDPATAWSGVDGEASLDLAIPLVGHLYRGTIAFALTSTERRLWGSGSFTHPLQGTTTTLTVAAGSPLVVRPATGAADAASNACGYSIAGQAQVEITGSAGRLRTIWSFDPARTSVAVVGSQFTDSLGATTSLPDSTVDLRCGTAATIGDWAATFDQHWACLPIESGHARLTISVSGADTIRIVDEDPPGSGDVKTYDATIVASSARAVRGYFLGGTTANPYREDFTWTLGRDGASFSQISTYAYAGGGGGLCVASARRLP